MTDERLTAGGKGSDMERVLEYMLCNGTWREVEADRIEDHIERLMAENGIDGQGRISPRCLAVRPLSRDEVMAALESGRTLRNAPEDWYSQSRYRPAPPPPQPAPEMIRCDCGHTIPKAVVMSASRGTSCPDCYDRMSD